MKLLGIAVAAALGGTAVMGLSGCAPAKAPSIALAGGTTSCVPDGASKPGILSVAFHNTTGGAITVTGGSVSGADVEGSDVWILDATAAAKDEVDYGISPFSTLPRWASRQSIGSVRVGAGKWASIAVSFNVTSPAAQVTGLTMNYRSADGATGVAGSDASGAFSTEC